MKKTIKHILIFLLIVAVAPSCDSWLDVTSSNEVRSKDQFQSKDGFKDALVGVYVAMGDPNLYGRDMTWNLVDILSQQYAPLTVQANYARVQQYQYESVSAAPQIAALWEHEYTNIANINNELSYIDENGDVLNPIIHDVIKGELLGLRVFLHFDLMRLYGAGDLADRPGKKSDLDIPYVTEYKKQITPRKSYDATFTLMQNDLNEALDLLKNDPVYQDPDRPDDYYEGINQNGFFDNRENRMNYYAVKALQARVFAWMGGTDNMNQARMAAEDVINNGPARLINSGSYPIGSDPILYPEMLFGLHITNFEDIVDSYLNANDRTNYDAVYLTSGMADDIYETDNAGVGPSDIRYNTLLEQQTQGLVSIKLYQGDVINHPDIMPLMKLPEMYYIAAEYYANNGALSKAIDDLNTVRSSRGIIEAIPDTASQETVNNEIFKEYRKEYVSEGQLFFYYKRIGRDHIPGLSQNTTVGDDIYILPYPDSETEFRN